MPVLMFMLTILSFMIMGKIYSEYRTPVLTPVLTTVVSLVVILLLFDIPYDTYMKGAGWIDRMLGPAVVALAYPMYRQRAVLQKHFLPVIGSVVVGVVTAFGSGYVMAASIGLERELLLTLLPKSLTTPIAVPVTSEIGGIPSMAVAFTMIAGFTAILTSPLFFKYIPFKDMGKGIALGTAAHGLGTSKAIEYGEETVSMSSVAMSLAAIIGSFFGPFFVWLLSI
ncbi:LrgB family protein [Salimicrobium flavidum]|uniref:TIGR00659 family protein n=1 Tax=Salimicrobium flavidum TaxID=570947 RepID=A0A1N7J760_9BACI|nr:LrgB family protein [Salimicrobium flavidum]SIS45149.1 TIGR00659 family protein [Salimicrobium flavidum]